MAKYLDDVGLARLWSKIKDYVSSQSHAASPLDAYPVGAIYLSMSATSPQTLFGGKWQKLEGNFLMFSDSSHAAGTTGGSNDAVVVSHTHSGESDTDGSHTHSISGGSHSHSGSTSSGGSHYHGIDSRNGVLGVGIDNSAKNATTTSNPYWYIHRIYKTENAGAHTHSVTVNTSSSHSHTMTSAGSHYHVLTIDSAGQSGTGKNMPKYIAVNAWERTA